MDRLAITYFSAQNISSAKLLDTFTSTDDGELFIHLYLDSLAGGGTYKACLTKQVSGSGLNYQSPTTSVGVASTVSTAFLPTISTPVKVGDVIKIYAEGLAGDTSISGMIEYYDAAHEYDINIDVPISTRLSGSYIGNIASASAVDNITGTSASTIWTYYERYLTSGSNLNIVGTSASTIWTYAERYLTSGSNLGFSSASSVQEVRNLITTLQSWIATNIDESIVEGEIIQIRGNSWDILISDVVLDTNKQQFAIKSRVSQTDSDSLLLVDSIDGLTVLNGQTPSGSATLTYDSSASTLNLVVSDASVTAQLPAGAFHYGIQYITSASLVYENYGGNFTITTDIVRGTE